MKKTISFILSVSLLASMICIPVSAMEEVIVSESIEEFCKDVNEMINEYSESEFVTPNFIEEEQTTANTDEEVEINYCPRLIVQTDKPIDTYDAIDVVSGFFNFYIVQFENEKDTNYAYEQYKNNPDIISVEYDISYDAVTLSTEKTSINKELTYEDYKNGWYLEATGMNMVLERYKNQNLPEIVVAVVDTGVDLNCEYLQNRLIPTGFNNAGDGDEGSEQDYYDHGTAVTSVIVNCTTDNVKIANYRCINSKGEMNGFVLGCCAILQAINDGADVVNCSFMLPGEYELMQQVIDYAYSSSCIIVAGAGNLLGDIGIKSASPLNTSDKVISVGSSNQYNSPSSFTAFGEPVDILAPGEEMPLIHIKNKIYSVEGTSFSSPFIASVYSMFYATRQTTSFKERVRVIKNCGDGTDDKYVTGLFGSGIVNPLKLFGLDLVEEPTFSLDTGKYIGKISLELNAQEGTEIYYTTDSSYPTPTNSTLYIEPIKLDDEALRVRAVAYKNGNRSNYVMEDICSVTLGTDDMFTINSDGIITSYTGSVNYLKIPETIKGITVTDIAYSSGFSNAEIYGVILPNTIEYLGYTMGYYERKITSVEEQVGAFMGNDTIEFIVGENIKVLGYYGVSNLKNLCEVDFPNCEHIMMRAFYNCSSLFGAVFPLVKIVGREAFWEVPFMNELYLPSCEKIGYRAFYSCSALSILYMPNADFLDYEETNREHLYDSSNPSASKLMFNFCRHLTKLDLPEFRTIGEDSFEKSAIKRLELSNIQYIYDIPTTFYYNDTFYGDYYQPVPVELSLPFTLQYCVPATDYKNEYIEYVVYGTAGKNSYAQQWAEENDVEFINISQETAIVKDIEPIWDKYSYEPLEFDARGFNRMYQWYGSKDKIQGNYDDKPIKNATDKTFNPDDYKSYPYYYCIMTSTDKDIDGNIVSQVIIKSSMCQNRLYYMVSLPNTHIDFDNHLIYTKTTGCKNFFNIIGIQDNTSYSSLPSLVYKEHSWYGTGSEFVIFNGTKKERYTLIVEGDVTGDSAVDVIDASFVALVANNLATLEDEYFLAADTNLDQEITVEDYAQVVNLVLAG